MSIFDGLKSAVRGHFDKKKQDREFEERMRLEASIQRRQVFEEDYRKHTLEVAKAQAHKEAAQKSGIAKLRAHTRLRRLNEDSVEPGSAFEKLRDLTQRNKARTEANIKRTTETRAMALKMRQDKTQERESLRQERMAKVQERKAFGIGNRQYII